MAEQRKTGCNAYHERKKRKKEKKCVSMHVPSTIFAMKLGNSINETRIKDENF